MHICRGRDARGEDQGFRADDCCAKMSAFNASLPFVTGQGLTKHKGLLPVRPACFLTCYKNVHRSGKCPLVVRMLQIFLEKDARLWESDRSFGLVSSDIKT